MLNAEWIPVNTATDVPLMLGIAHTLVEQGKHDKDFLKKYTSGYAKFEEYLLGKTDGQPKQQNGRQNLWCTRQKQLSNLQPISLANVPC